MGRSTAFAGGGAGRLGSSSGSLPDQIKRISDLVVGSSNVVSSWSWCGRELGLGSEKLAEDSKEGKFTQKLVEVLIINNSN